MKKEIPYWFYYYLYLSNVCMLEWIGIIMFGPKPKTTTACTLKVKNSYDLKCPELVPFLSYKELQMSWMQKQFYSNQHFWNIYLLEPDFNSSASQFWTFRKSPFIRYHSRFFVRVGHETTYAAIGNHHFFTIPWYLPKLSRTSKLVQGVKGESGKSLSSKFGRNQCLYWNKRDPQKKALIFSFKLTPWKWL